MMGFKHEMYEDYVYLSAAGSGALSGEGPDDAKAMTDGAIADVPEGVVITEAYLVEKVAVVGLTALTVGDGGDPDGLIAAADLSLGTPGSYKGAGAYIADGRYYSAADTIDLDVTGTATAGEAVVYLKGFRID